MIYKSVVIIWISLSVRHLLAIPCEFKFVEHESRHKGKVFDGINFKKVEVSTTKSPEGIFECEDHEDDDDDNDNGKDKKSSNISTLSTLLVPKSLEQQYIFQNPDEDNYEDLEPTCQVIRRTIQPKALNNIYNKLTKVVNTANYIQSISIEQCLSKKEPCNGNVIPPVGRFHICRQKHVKITLKAFEDDERKIVDEQFYYPSHCVCELVTVKKKVTQRPPISKHKISGSSRLILFMMTNGK